MFTFFKDPQALLDYTIDWSLWLGTGQIQTSTWTVDPALFSGPEQNTPTTTTIWLGDGVVGEQHRAVNTIQTTDGLTDERTIILVIQER